MDKLPWTQLVKFHSTDFQKWLKDTERWISSFERNDWQGFLAAISRDDINPTTLDEHDYRVCSRHFVSGEPVDLCDVNHPDWLPTLQWVMIKEQVVLMQPGMRERKKVAWEAIITEVKIIVSDLVQVVTEDVRNRLRLDYNMLKLMQYHLNVIVLNLWRSYRISLLILNKQATPPLPPFCKEKFVRDDFTLTYTGLPNFKVLKAVFNHVNKTLPSYNCHTFKNLWVWCWS